MRTVAVLSVALCLFAGVLASDVTVLTPDNFDDVIGGSQPALVEFYAPWCGHCKALAPVYEELATTFKSDSVVVANVDADANRELGSRFGVTGFPTLKWFPAGSDTPEDYSGGRSVEDLVDFINSKTGLKRRVKKAPTAVVTLTPSNFDDVVMDPSKNVLVEFYAPWCGHCKSLAPVYEEVAKTFESESDVVVASVDADKHRDLGSAYGVSGFPTLKFFAAGDDKEAEPYESGRDATSLVDFLNGAAGTHRVVGGGLTDMAGRLADFDFFAAQFMSAADDAGRQAVMDEAANSMDVLTDEEATAAKMYIKAMTKVMKKGAEYVEKERARLGAMLDSGSVSPNKKTFFMLRRNVLAAFETDEE